jgi:hypothetical protein
MNARLPPKDRFRLLLLLRAVALVVAATSLAYTGIWLYFNDPLATTMSEDLGLPRERLLQPRVRLGFQLRHVGELGGVRVIRVDPGGPAERAGLRADDVIVALDGRSLAGSAAPLLAAYRSARPGEPIELTVARPGAAGEIVLRGTFEARPLSDRLRVLVLGALVGLAPVVLAGVLSDLGIWRPPGWVTTLLYVMVYLFPLSFAYAVLKHRVLELPVLLRRSARYVFVKRGFMVLVLLLGAQASAFFALSFGRLLDVEPSVATTAGVGFGFLLAGVSAPLIRRTTRLIDRSFFRDAYDARLVLQELAERIRAVTSRHELAALLRAQLGRALHPSSIVVYLPDARLRPPRADGRPAAPDPPLAGRAGGPDLAGPAPGVRLPLPGRCAVLLSAGARPGGHLVQVGGEPIEGGRREIAKIAAEDQQVFGLGGGALGEEDAVGEVHRTLSPRPGSQAAQL